MGYYGWRPYVPVAEKRRQAERKLATLKKGSFAGGGEILR